MKRNLNPMVRVLVFFAALALVSPAWAQSRPDGWITLKAKLALLAADDVDGTDISVDTINHRVTLHGDVESEAEKAAAERVVRDIEGVAEVNNFLEVVPEAREEAVEETDERIQERVEEILSKDYEGVDVEVESVENGVVVLSGEADSMARQVRIVDRVARIPGVRDVENRIEAPEELREPESWRERELGGERRAQELEEETEERDIFEDMWITSAVKMKLLANGDVPALDINVDTWNGEVTLFGIVGNEAASQEAERVAQSTEGVREVHNELQVVPESAEEDAERQDEEIEELVEEALEERGEFDDIEIEVKNGVVRLTGEADSVTDRLSAATLARSVPGVKAVINDLRLKRQT